MKVGKPTSKRVPVRLRNKIQKASAAKQRKDRKLAKKNPQWRSRIKKDPGIPNLFPYKDKILHEIEESKRQKAEDALRRKEDARNRRQQVEELDEEGDAGMKVVEDDPDALLDYEGSSVDEAMDQDDDNASSNPMAALLASASARATEYNEVNDHEDFDSASDSEDSFDDFDTATTKAKPSSTSSGPHRSHHTALKDLTKDSDVILYILDARDPQGTRSPSLEQAVTSDPDKRLLLVLNKIDLIPPPVLSSWLSHLRRSFPTLPLRAASSAPNAQTFDHGRLTPAQTATTLLKALKTYAGGQKLKRAITVGIAGYPNVGKSSVVNALTSRLGGSRGGSKCPVGAEAGVTTALREVKLDGKIKLLDSPGVVPAEASLSTSTSLISTNGTSVSASTNRSRSSNSHNSKANAATDEQARLILLNAIPPHEITDPIPAVSLLLQRLSQKPELFNQLLKLYNAPALSSGPVDAEKARLITNDFLIHVARKRGRLGQGGRPNLWSAAMCVVGDWRDGRVRGWVDAPLDAAMVGTGVANGENGGVAVGISGAAQRKVVKEWAEEFKLDGLWGDDSAAEVAHEETMLVE